MKILLRIGKWLAVILVFALIGFQFFRPARTNPSVDQSQTIQATLTMPPEVASILDRSCQDCHSNATRWPWYSNVAPASWLLVDHVNEGRENLNLSEWGHYDSRQAEHKLEEICDEVKIGAMPMYSYTLIHRGAILSPQDVKTLCDWTTTERARLASLRSALHKPLRW